MATIDSEPDFAKRAIPLLIEYEQKLRRISEESDCIAKELLAMKSADGSVERDDYTLPRTRQQTLHSSYTALRVPVMSLARHVSQQIEHTTQNDLDRVELRLRLAEMEDALEAARVALKAVKALLPS